MKCLFKCMKWLFIHIFSLYLLLGKTLADEKTLISIRFVRSFITCAGRLQQLTCSTRCATLGVFDMSKIQI